MTMPDWQLAIRIARCKAKGGMWDSVNARCVRDETRDNVQPDFANLQPTMPAASSFEVWLELAKRFEKEQDMVRRVTALDVAFTEATAAKAAPKTVLAITLELTDALRNGQKNQEAVEISPYLTQMAASVGTKDQVGQALGHKADALEALKRPAEADEAKALAKLLTGASKSVRKPG